MNDPMREHARDLLEATAKCLEAIEGASAADFRQRIQVARQVFVAGAGRTGYIARCFAMRLMHLGLPVHVVGEATAPAPTHQDLLLLFSGTGETLSTCEVASRAADRHVPMSAVTANPDSRLARTAGSSLVIPAVEGGRFPLGTLFESALFGFLDATVLALKDEMRVRDDEMSARHALG